MKARWMAPVLMAWAVAACVDHATLTPVNAQAQAAGGGRMDFAKGLGGGPMRIVLSTGEVFPGDFSISEATVQNNFTATARNARSRLACQGTIAAGHGTARCEATDGSIYDLTL